VQAAQLRLKNVTVRRCALRPSTVSGLEESPIIIASDPIHNNYTVGNISIDALNVVNTIDRPFLATGVGAYSSGQQNFDAQTISGSVFVTAASRDGCQLAGVQLGQLDVVCKLINRSERSNLAHGGLNHITFAPNQLAANLWYHAGVNRSLINGHVEGSFSNLGLWSHLQHTLASNHGQFGMVVAELQYVADQTLLNFKRAGLGISVEDNTFTQCQDGTTLANLTFFGQHSNLICEIWKYCPGNSKWPGLTTSGFGWYRTVNGSTYAPDEITFDERMPHLLPQPTHLAQLWNVSIGGWQERKAAAFRDSCPTAAIWNPGVDRIPGLISDYVEFLQVAKRRYGFAGMPRFAVHWNVIAWWEWSDIECLDTLAMTQTNLTKFRHAVQYLTQPCHRDTEHLVALVEAMCDSGSCPSAVYHDVDYVYNTPYALDVLRRNKQALGAAGVSFGLDIVDLCTGDLMCEVIVDSSGNHLRRRSVGTATDPNLLQQATLTTIVCFLIKHGILDSETVLRLQSWTERPIETGDATSEQRNGSFAHTANAIIRTLLLGKSCQA
jgi:hypothetical protein